MKHRRTKLILENIDRFQYRDGKLFYAEKVSRKARKNQEAGSTDSYGYRQVKIHGVNVFAHQIVWLMFNSDLPVQIDHINRNRSDNRIENLRESNNALNQQNRSLSKNNTSGEQGVTLHGNKWYARIGLSGKRIGLGSFNTIQEATLAYKKAKEIYHGDTAKT